MRRDSVSLDDKYSLEQGEIYLSGIQALVRLPLMQRARDAAAGLSTAGFISGYRGSPLSGLDQQLSRASGHLDASDIVFLPGLNEELAATAVWGSQQLGLHPGARHDGVFGMWYGKAPGVDRACDALRHANAAGTAPLGGVLLVAGDDHACKSSSYPTQSEFAMMHLEIPVLSPSSVQDVLDYGLYGWALSRYAGLWVCLVALTDMMDSSAVVSIDREHPSCVLPRDFVLPSGGVHIRTGDNAAEQERRVREVKLPAALAFARANGLCRVVFDTPQPRLVIVATGKAYTDTRQALCDMGIDEAAARQIGIRLVKVGMPWPLDAQTMRGFVTGSETVLVVEEKRALIETQLREQLYDLPDDRRPRIVGKCDERGEPLLARTLELDAAEIARVIALHLPAGVSTERIDDFLARLAAEETSPRVVPSSQRRMPFFCSGCPHNTGTRLPDGSRALAGIGCHYMVQWMNRSSDHFCQMGGEGAAWLGQAPFSEEEHIFANLGDGTYFHSGILAIRAAVAAGARITYKLLYNGAVAMTGGQPLEGGLGVPEITRQLAAEGVREIVVVSEAPERYRADEGLAPGVSVEPRAQLDAVQKRLRACPGVTVLIYDQACAAEKRRKRKRGLLEEPRRRVFINQRLCEGCGDCSAVSNCLSVEPVESELGRKRHINQFSCNQDFSCVDGTCPAIVSVIGGTLRKRPLPDFESLVEALPTPQRRPIRGVYNVLLTGVGGTGVTTAAALLGMAAHIEGRGSVVLDMTGLAQKGGAVLSHVRLAESADEIYGGRIPKRSADLMLACDLVVAAGARALETLDTRRTRCVLDMRLLATAAFVMDNEVRYDRSEMVERVRHASREIHAVDGTRIVEGMFGDSIGSNVFLLGYAYQLGRIPLEIESIEHAIDLNGAAAPMNRRAFSLGRLAAHDPKPIDDWMAAVRRDQGGGELDDLIAQRETCLSEYQDLAYAARYRALVERVRQIEGERVPGSRRLSRAAARCIFKLMAYKDEYEVARLYTDGRFHEELEQEFDGDYRLELHLSPPAFARRDAESGRLVKRTYGQWAFRLLGWLARGKWLRGTSFDPFGYQAERRLERALVAQYDETLEEILRHLTPANHEVACRLAEWPEQIRGFDQGRAAGIEGARQLRARLIDEFRSLT